MKLIQTWAWKRKYRPGQVISRFIAKDIKREVQVVATYRIKEGIITGRVRTWNLLYASKGLGEVQELEIAHLWNWAGAPWGGPVPDAAEREA